MSCVRFASLLAAACLLAPRASADPKVWVVDPTTLETTLDAAHDGDVLVLQEGIYTTWISLDFLFLSQKSLTLTAEVGADVRFVYPIRLAYLGAGHTVTLQGLRIEPIVGTIGYALDLSSCEGTIVVENCTLRQGLLVPDQGPALGVHACASVVLRNSTFQGPEAAENWTGGLGAVFRDSNVAAFGCTFRGGKGGGVLTKFGSCSGSPGWLGGGGASSGGGSLLLQDSHLEGGEGGPGDSCSSAGGCGAGGPGGPGLYVGTSSFTGEASTVTLVGSTLVGGAGGSPGFSPGGRCVAGADGDPASVSAGSLTDLDVPPRTLDVPPLLREGELATVAASGEPFELLAVYAALDVGSFPLPSVYGSLFLAPPGYLLGAAPLDATGTLALQATVPDLGVGAEALRLWMQVVSLPTTGGVVLGEPALLVVLDAAF